MTLGAPNRTGSRAATSARPLRSVRLHQDKTPQPYLSTKPGQVQRRTDATVTATVEEVSLDPGRVGSQPQETGPNQRLTIAVAKCCFPRLRQVLTHFVRNRSNDARYLRNESASIIITFGNGIERAERRRAQFMVIHAARVGKSQYARRRRTGRTY
jgi:hypothetical protein